MRTYCPLRRAPAGPNYRRESRRKPRLTHPLERQESHFPRARDFYAQALATMEAAGRDATLTYGAYLRDYGAILYEMGDYPAAEAVARRALSLTEQLAPGESLDVAHSASFLGLVLAKEGRDQEAAPLHRRALFVRERELGPQHDLTLASLVFLARSLQAQGRAAGAESLW